MASIVATATAAVTKLSMPYFKNVCILFKGYQNSTFLYFKS